MNRKLLLVSILAIALFSSSCSVLWELSVEAQAEKLRLQLKNKQFGKIYDESTDSVHRNVSREEFIERTSKIVEEMERVDENINWQPNDYLGKTFAVETYSQSTYLRAYKELGDDNRKILIQMSWEKVNGKIKFSHLTAFTSSDAERPFNINVHWKTPKSK
ncbi:MAG TPA: hypothetical protein VGB00_10265 [Pyrinomonadaceae bacterium]|jgi:hypothetical protein